MIESVSIEIKKIIVSLVVAYITWKIYSYLDFWKFTFVFIMGGVNLYILDSFNKKHDI